MFSNLIFLQYAFQRLSSVTLPLEVAGDVLVIAGDVGYLVDTTIPHLRFWKWASENYRQVLVESGKCREMVSDYNNLFCITLHYRLLDKREVSLKLIIDVLRKLQQLMT